MTFASRTTSRAIVEPIAIFDGIAAERHDRPGRFPGFPRKGWLSRGGRLLGRDHDLATLIRRQTRELTHERFQTGSQSGPPAAGLTSCFHHPHNSASAA